MGRLRLLELDEESIKRALADGDLVVAIYGMGHVGLPLAVAWLRAGARVIGVDVDERKVELLNRGECPIDEPVVPEVIRKAWEEGRFRATTDGVRASAESDVKLIAVPTLVRLSGDVPEADLSALRKALEAIGKGLGRGDLVIIESSVPPGTTEGIAREVLERESGLKAEEDFGLAYSPERIAEGRALRDIEEAYPKIVAGIGPRSTRAAKALYERIARRGVIVLSRPAAAEFEKLAEGVYRDVNIALANELAMLAHELGLDFEEIRRAANSQPYCHLHVPGAGVGGLCIPIYPYFMEAVARSRGMSLRLTMTARKLNEGMPAYVVDLALRALHRAGVEPREARVAILGDAFRGGIGDARLSPTHDIVRELRARGLHDIVVHDPYVERDPELEAPLVKSLDEALRRRNLVIVATDHPEYRGLSAARLRALSGASPLIIVDGRLIIDYRDAPADVIYVGVGRPWAGGSA